MHSSTIPSAVFYVHFVQTITHIITVSTFYCCRPLPCVNVQSHWVAVVSPKTHNFFHLKQLSHTHLLTDTPLMTDGCPSPLFSVRTNNRDSLEQRGALLCDPDSSYDVAFLLYCDLAGLMMASMQNITSLWDRTLKRDAVFPVGIITRAPGLFSLRYTNGYRVTLSSRLPQWIGLTYVRLDDCVVWLGDAHCLYVCWLRRAPGLFFCSYLSFPSNPISVANKVT